MMYLGPMKYRVCWLILIQASCHRRPEVAMERPELAPLLRLWDGLGNAVGGLPTTRQRLLRLTGEAWSDDRTVRAVVGPRGQLVELQIDPRVYRRPDANEVARAGAPGPGRAGVGRGGGRGVPAAGGRGHPRRAPAHRARRTGRTARGVRR